jgi:hypothetical protein
MRMNELFIQKRLQNKTYVQQIQDSFNDSGNIAGTHTCTWSIGSQ